MTDEYDNDTLTPTRLGIVCLVGAAMWGVIIWTGMRWYALLT